MASFDKVLAINPSDANTWHNRGHVLVDLGRYSEAVVSYDKAFAILAINSNDTDAKVTRIWKNNP